MQKLRLIYCLVAFWGLLSCVNVTTHADMSNRPAVAISRAASPVKVDAVVSTGEWDAAAAITNFVLAESGRFAQEQSTIKIQYDDRNIYLYGRLDTFALDPVSNMADSFKATVKDRDGNVWADDSIELRFEPLGQNASPIYIAINALGTILDMKQTSRGWEKPWDGPIEVAAAIHEGYWSFELSIPLSTIGMTPSNNRPTCLFNAVRFEQRLEEKSSWVRLPDGNHMNHANLGRIVLAERLPTVQIQPFSEATFAQSGIPVRIVGDSKESLRWKVDLLHGERVIESVTGMLSNTADLVTLKFSNMKSDDASSIRFFIFAGSRAVYSSTEYEYGRDAASLEVTARASDSFDFFVNGRSIATSVTSIDDLLISLEPGANVIAVRVNAGQPLAMRLRTIHGEVFETDRTWRVGPNSDAAINPDTDDSIWSTARPVSSETSLSGISSVVADGRGLMVLRKTILYKSTQLFPKLADNIWQLSEGGTYMLHWNGSGATNWQLDRSLLDFRLTIDVPEGLAFVGASGRPIANTAAVAAGLASAGPAVQYKSESHGLVTYRGTTYRRYVIERDKPVALTDAKEAWLDRTRRKHEGLWIAIKALPGTSHASRPVPPIIYFSHANDDSFEELPNRLDVKVLPRLSGRSPEKLTIALYGHSGLVNNSQMLEGYFDTIKAAGVTELFAECESDYPRQIGLKQTHFFNFGTSSRVGFGLAHVMIDGLLDRFPDAQAVAFNGRRMPTPCLSYLARHDDVWPLIEEQIAGIAQRNPSMTHLFWDYEFPPFPEGLHAYPMFSKFGMETFATLYNIDEPLTPERIRKQYAAQWVDFTCGEIATVVSRLARIAHRHDMMFAMYSGYDSEYTHRRYNVDWRKVGPHIDRAYCGYTKDKAVVEHTQAALAGTPLVGALLLMGETAQSHNPAQMLRKIVNHGGGVLCWYESRFDARTLASIAEVSRLVAEYVPIMVERRRCDTRFQTQPDDSIVAYELGDETLILLINDRSSSMKIFNVQLPAGSVASNEFYSGRTVSRGRRLTMPVGSGEVAAFLVSSGGAD